MTDGKHRQHTDTDHDCLADNHMAYIADYGAPGIGQAWQCTTCARQWAQLGDHFYPAESDAHILTPEQCE